MKFINSKYVAADWVSFAEENNGVINVRFCRDCPLFEYDNVQRELPRRHGICNRLSRDNVFAGEWPHFIHTYEDSFCNEDDIGNEEDN